MNKGYFPPVSEFTQDIWDWDTWGTCFLLGPRPPSHFTYCRPNQFHLWQSEPICTKFKEKTLGIGVHGFASYFIDPNSMVPLWSLVLSKSRGILDLSLLPFTKLQVVFSHFGLIANFILLVLIQCHCISSKFWLVLEWLHLPLWDIQVSGEKAVVPSWPSDVVPHRLLLCPCHSIHDVQGHVT